MTDLYHTYELTADDVFKHAHFTIIELSGVNKIMTKAGIEIDYNVEGCNAQYAAVRCEATFPDGQRIVTFGSASPDNCRSPNYLEMAEKRAKSRRFSCSVVATAMAFTRSLGGTYRLMSAFG